VVVVESAVQPKWSEYIQTRGKAFIAVRNINIGQCVWEGKMDLPSKEILDDVELFRLQHSFDAPFLVFAWSGIS
jgi:hypothetical protein